MQLTYRIFLHANGIDEQHGNPKDIALPVDNNNKSQHNDNINRKQTTDNKNDFSSNNRYTNNMNDNRNSNSNGRSYSATTNDASLKSSDTDNQFLVPSTDFKRLRSYACVNSVSGTNLNSPPRDLGTKKTTISANNKSGTVTHDGTKQSEYKTNLSLATTTTVVAPVAYQTLSKASEENEREKSKNNDSHSNNNKVTTTTKDMGTKTKVLTEKQHQSDINKEELKLRYEAENSKKCYTNTKKSTSSPRQVSEASSTKPEIPKLRIEVPQTKSKDGNDGIMPKIILKLSSPIEKRPAQAVQVNQNVDVTEYAKNIGLLPVSELQERKKRESERSDELSHKKRKKAKHSKEKEPNAKKCKIHAEVSSMTLNDEVKLKVKISKPPSKHEKRGTSVEQSKSSEAQKSPSVKDTNKEDSSEKTPQPPTSSILRTVRHKPQAMVFIPNLDKNMPEEQDSISDIVKRVQQVPVNKSPVNTLSPNKPQTPPKVNSPGQKVTPGSPLQKRESPVLVQKPELPKEQVQQKQQQQHPQQKPLARQGPNPVQKQMSPMEAFQMLQKAQLQAAGRVLMPPFSQASQFDIRMQRMSSPSNIGRAFSPRPSSMGNSLSLLAPSSVPQRGKTLFGLPTQFPSQQQQRKQSVKRPAGYDPPLPMPKTPRVNHMESEEQKNITRKQMYAPMCAPTEPRPIMSKPALAPVPVPKAPTSPQPQSKKTLDQKKPLSRLIAPSSISVTRVGDASNVPVPQVNRPAVEILRIPSTVPAIDQKSNANKPQQKTTRPPPGTIPLFKFQKTIQMGKGQPPVNPKNEGDKALDLSLSPTGGTSSKKVESGQVIDLTDSNETTEERPKAAQKSMTPPTIQPAKSNGTNTNKSTKPVMPGLTALVLPKNQEMLKNRGLMRQQNLSVRNVPNPSALAFRNQSGATLPSLAKVTPATDVSEKVQQLHNMKEQQRQRIAPED